MRVLALDTTTRAGSAALVEDDRVVDQRRGDDSRTHALRLPAEILELVATNHWSLSDIDLYAVACGPGSFTGLRIGIATMQGLASVHRRRIVSVTALEALAHAAANRDEASLVAPWMDAHRSDVFAALYRVNRARSFSAERLTELEGPTVGTPAATLARWRTMVAGSSALFVGDGAVLYEPDIRRELPAGIVVPAPQLAAAVGLLAIDRAGTAREPSAVRPLYVRRSDVELVRDEQLRRRAESSRDT